jgi:hypothetical protein
VIEKFHLSAAPKLQSASGGNAKTALVGIAIADASQNYGNSLRNHRTIGSLAQTTIGGESQQPQYRYRARNVIQKRTFVHF